MKRNKNIFLFRICSLLVFISLVALTFTACGKSEVNKADELNTTSKISRKTAGEQNPEDVVAEQTSQETASEPSIQDTATEQTAPEATYEQISQEEAKTLMDTEKDYIILDVRTEEEYTSGHIVGAICIPNETIDDTVTSQLADKNQLILIYCRSGNRSKQASEKLVDLGYTNIKEFGGINSWPYETE